MNLGRGPLSTRLHDNGLLIACLLLFAVFFGGMVIAGHANYNEQQQEHGSGTVSMFDYVRTGDFVEATFENWESEFLQMGMYVVLTAFLYQRGSSESKPVEYDAPQDADPRTARLTPSTPWPVRAGAGGCSVPTRIPSLQRFSCCSSPHGVCTPSAASLPTTQSRTNTARPRSRCGST